ncbi:5338_t:CDS:2 [Acaulospora morrowiae]|uniref:5338_t:CDS:1 n=1 Tax=Acaulospora morrowiae TaxID=94023 RepID=A0A9N9GD17_9GLOM|nr:5338_t:CDS:2 [Acaulospora morrowiae]
MFSNVFSLFSGEQSAVVDVLNIESTTVPEPSHPYYPLNLKLVKYTEPTYSFVFLLTCFFCAVSVVAILSLILIYHKKSVASLDKGYFIWFNITGCIHVFLEGYLSLFYGTIAEDNGIMSQLWKEYSLSDSRYLSSDPFVVIMESVTAAIWGPVAFLTSIAIYNNYPSRHLLQLTISIGLKRFITGSTLSELISYG